VAVSVLGNAEVRYRVPVVPLLALLAAWALWGLLWLAGDRLRLRKPSATANNTANA
jgi:hypothetical protein